MKRAPLLALAALASAPAFAVGLGPLAKSGVTDTDRKGFYLTLINPYPTATAFHAYAIGPEDETEQARVRILPAATTLPPLAAVPPSQEVTRPPAPSTIGIRAQMS